MSTPTRDSAPPRSRAPENVKALPRPSAGPGAERARSVARGSWQVSPSLGRRELAAAIAAGVALAVLMSWPLLLHLRSRISPDLGDPVRTAWQIAWVGHAMLHDPLHLFDSNAFYPHPLSLAFSDSLLGYGPMGFFGSGTLAALLRYNLIFLLTWSLCFVGAYLLARELGVRRIGATVAGVAFAYAPYRATEAGHFQVISSGGIPLALFLLLRGYRRRSRALVLTGWLVSAWQLSLGWTLGLVVRLPACGAGAARCLALVAGTPRRAHCIRARAHWRPAGRQLPRCRRLRGGGRLPGNPVPGGGP
jgi:hypothetical protein